MPPSVLVSRGPQDFRRGREEVAAIDRLRELADAVKRERALGRSVQLERLFDYLVERAAQPGSPKEAEIAQAVLARDDLFDSGQDATVRVQMHRLRRKLDEHYADTPAADRLILPAGEYRLTVQTTETAPPDADPPTSARRGVRLSPTLLALSCLLVGAAIALAAVALWPKPSGQIASTGFWSLPPSNARPTLLVVGDYYIFGERREDAEGERLVREFAINSAHDLDQHLMLHPDRIGRYINLNLHYMPIGAASAIAAILPALTGDGRAVRVVPTSRLTADMIRDANIVYVGYLSGLGLLQDAVFTGSRLTSGASYDEIVDRRTGTRYRADWRVSAQGRLPRTDYAYLSSFDGPSGNRIVIVAGTRDAALAQAAEMATDPARLARWEEEKLGRNVEALFRVGALGNTNLSGKLVMAVTRGAD